MVLKVLGIAILCILSITLFLKVVVPAGALVLGLGIDVPNNWAQSRKALFFYSHPGVALLTATVLMVIFCWGVIRLIRL
jgi:hypothetical protein